MIFVRPRVALEISVSGFTSVVSLIVREVNSQHSMVHRKSRVRQSRFIARRDRDYRVKVQFSPPSSTVSSCVSSASAHS